MVVVFADTDLIKKKKIKGGGERGEKGHLLNVPHLRCRSCQQKHSLDCRMFFFKVYSVSNPFIYLKLKFRNSLFP